jgi:RecA-family ATPase
MQDDADFPGFAPLDGSQAHEVPLDSVALHPRDFGDMAREEGGAAVVASLKGAIQPAPKEKEGPWQLPIIDTSAWIGREPPARRWIVKGWLARATGGAMFGEDGIGKSLLGQQLATCIAAGRPFLGLETTQAGALYLTCEDDELSLWQRQRAISKALGLPADCAPAMLSTVVGYLAAELGQFDEHGSFVPGAMFHAIVARAQSINAGLIVLDNIAHLFPGNEIVRRQVVAFLAAVDQLAMTCDASVLLLGHPAKAVGSEYSGNLGWSAHVRQRWFLGWGDPALGDSDTRVLRKAKANLGKRGEEVEFRWHEWAFVIDEDLPDDTRAEIAKVAQLGHDNELFLLCLAEMTRQERNVSEKRSASFAPTMFAKMSESKGIGKERLEAAMDRLFRLGTIKRGTLPWKRDRKEIEGLIDVR